MALDDVHDELLHPVTAEEMHLALMTLTPLLLDANTNKDDKVLEEFARNHAGLLDKNARVSWLFNFEAHYQRVDRWYIPEDEEKQVLRPKSASISSRPNSGSSRGFPESSGSGKPSFADQD